MIRQVTEDNNKISYLYSHLGYRALSGDVEAVKWFYANAWREIPPLIRTLSTLQECLTASEIKKSAGETYCDEFLYYWGMINIGEVSDLIFKDLGTAEFCFKKIEQIVPKAESRLAFIKLLKTDEQRKSDSNMTRLEVLRHWGIKQDFFSMIAIAKIIFQGFLEEDHLDNGELPMRLCRLLALPCQKGHPVAIRFWNEVIDYINPPAAMDMRISESKMDGDVLYDFYGC